MTQAIQQGDHFESGGYIYRVMEKVLPGDKCVYAVRVMDLWNADPHGYAPAAGYAAERKIERPIGTPETVAEKMASGELVGYRSGSPSMTREDQAANREIAKTAECANCGAKGCRLDPFVKDTRISVSYRLFVSCRRCGHAEEI